MTPTAQKRHDALERLWDRAMAFAPLWLEWAKDGSKEETELAGQVSSAQARLQGAAVDLYQAENTPDVEPPAPPPPPIPPKPGEKT